jgi:hypothetical protein
MYRCMSAQLRREPDKGDLQGEADTLPIYQSGLAVFTPSQGSMAAETHTFDMGTEPGLWV